MVLKLKHLEKVSDNHPNVSLKMHAKTEGKQIKNKIAQGDINIFSHFNIHGYVPFSKF